MKNLMMSLPKFLKVTPSSNLFAFRLQSTFKRYVYTKYFTTIYLYLLSKNRFVCYILHNFQKKIYFLFLLKCTFFSQDLDVTLTQPSQLKPKPASEELVFGKFFTDHMLRIHWTQNQGWSEPRITPFQHFQMHPAAKALHYAQELYEGE